MTSLLCHSWFCHSSTCKPLLASYTTSDPNVLSVEGAREDSMELEDGTLVGRELDGREDWPEELDGDGFRRLC
ncbi:hypothetical protein BST61_g1987 [Cercospora zeina]